MRLNPEALAAIRRTRRMTLRELARRSATSSAHLSRMENGQRCPSQEVIEAVAAALEVPVHAIASEDAA